LGGFFTSVSSHLKDGRFPVLDFRLEKVWMISCDPHKYAMSPKGCSVLLFKDKTLKIHSIYHEFNWPGGIYATPSMTGSNSSSAVIGAWASLRRLGMDGIIDNYHKIVKAIDKFKSELATIPELQIIGDPKGCSISFKFKKEFEKKFNIMKFKDLLSEFKKWHLSMCINPKAMRMSITRNNYDNMSKYLIDDIKSTLQIYKDNIDKYNAEKSDSMAFYGAMLKLPNSLSAKIIGNFYVYLNKLEDTEDKKN
jgi:sphinganine-1-phosphate aldolase